MAYEPRDKELYDIVKKYIYKKIPTHSAYRSGHLVKEYKRRYEKKYGTASKSYKKKTKKKTKKRTTKKPLKRWFKEKWLNDTGKVGYTHKNSIYRPTIKVTKNTPLTFSEISKKEIQRAKKEKYRTGRVKKFKAKKKSKK